MPAQNPDRVDLAALFAIFGMAIGLWPVLLTLVVCTSLQDTQLDRAWQALIAYFDPDKRRDDGPGFAA